jgi:hypothetical protein
MSYSCFSSVGALAEQEFSLATVATVATVSLPAQESVATVATVATPSPGTNEGGSGRKANPETVLAKAICDAEDCQAYFEERAAIREYDGGLPRDEAERLAFEDTVTHWFVLNPTAKGAE